MRIHLPASLRRALLKCLFACVTPTLFAGTLAGGVFMLSQPAAAAEGAPTYEDDGVKFWLNEDGTVDIEIGQNVQNEGAIVRDGTLYISGEFPSQVPVADPLNVTVRNLTTPLAEDGSHVGGSISLQYQDADFTGGTLTIQNVGTNGLTSVGIAHGSIRLDNCSMTVGNIQVTNGILGEGNQGVFVNSQSGLNGSWYAGFLSGVELRALNGGEVQISNVEFHGESTISGAWVVGSDVTVAAGATLTLADDFSFAISQERFLEAMGPDAVGIQRADVATIGGTGTVVGADTAGITLGGARINDAAIVTAEDGSMTFRQISADQAIQWQGTENGTWDGSELNWLDGNSPDTYKPVAFTALTSVKFGNDVIELAPEEEEGDETAPGTGSDLLPDDSLVGDGDEVEDLRELVKDVQLGGDAYVSNMEVSAEGYSFTGKGKLHVLNTLDIVAGTRFADTIDVSAPNLVVTSSENGGRTDFNSAFTPQTLKLQDAPAVEGGEAVEPGSGIVNFAADALALDSLEVTGTNFTLNVKPGAEGAAPAGSITVAGNALIAGKGDTTIGAASLTAEQGLIVAGAAASDTTFTGMVTAKGDATVDTATGAAALSLYAGADSCTTFTGNVEADSLYIAGCGHAGEEGCDHKGGVGAAYEFLGNLKVNGAADIHLDSRQTGAAASTLLQVDGTFTAASLGLSGSGSKLFMGAVTIGSADAEGKLSIGGVTMGDHGAALEGVTIFDDVVTVYGDLELSDHSEAVFYQSFTVTGDIKLGDAVLAFEKVTSQDGTVEDLGSIELQGGNDGNTKRALTFSSLTRAKADVHLAEGATDPLDLIVGGNGRRVELALNGVRNFSVTGGNVYLKDITRGESSAWGTATCGQLAGDLSVSGGARLELQHDNVFAETATGNISLSNSTLLLGSTTQTLRGDISLENGAITANSNGGLVASKGTSITFSGDANHFEAALILEANNLTISGSPQPMKAFGDDRLMVESNVSGTGQMTITGGGIVDVMSDLSFSGDVIIEGGAGLVLHSNKALYNAKSLTVGTSAGGAGALSVTHGGVGVQMNGQYLDANGKMVGGDLTLGDGARLNFADLNGHGSSAAIALKGGLYFDGSVNFTFTHSDGSELENLRTYVLASSETSINFSSNNQQGNEAGVVVMIGDRELDESKYEIGFHSTASGVGTEGTRYLTITMLRGSHWTGTAAGDADNWFNADNWNHDGYVDEASGRYVYNSYDILFRELKNSDGTTKATETIRMTKASTTTGLYMDGATDYVFDGNEAASFDTKNAIIKRGTGDLTWKNIQARSSAVDVSQGTLYLLDGATLDSSGQITARDTFNVTEEGGTIAIDSQSALQVNLKDAKGENVLAASLRGYDTSNARLATLHGVDIRGTSISGAAYADHSISDAAIDGFELDMVTLKGTGSLSNVTLKKSQAELSLPTVSPTAFTPHSNVNLTSDGTPNLTGIIETFGAGDQPMMVAGNSSNPNDVPNGSFMEGLLVPTAEGYELHVIARSGVQGATSAFSLGYELPTGASLTSLTLSSTGMSNQGFGKDGVKEALVLGIYDSATSSMVESMAAYDIFEKGGGASVTLTFADGWTWKDSYEIIGAFWHDTSSADSVPWNTQNTIKGITLVAELSGGIRIADGARYELGANVTLDGTVANFGTVVVTSETSLAIGAGVDTVIEGDTTTYKLFTGGSYEGWNGSYLNENNISVNGTALSALAGVELNGWDGENAAAAGTVSVTASGLRFTQWDAAWTEEGKNAPVVSRILTPSQGEMYLVGQGETYRYDQRFEGSAAEYENTYVVTIAESSAVNANTFFGAQGTTGTSEAPVDIWVNVEGQAYGRYIAGAAVDATPAADAEVQHYYGDSHLLMNGESVNMVNPVVGGSLHVVQHGDSYLSVAAGTFRDNGRVVAGSFSKAVTVMDSAMHDGDSHLHISGGTIGEAVGGSYQTYTKGNTHVELTGGKVTTLYGGDYTTAASTHTGNVTIDLRGGTVTNVYGAGSHDNLNLNKVDGDVLISLYADENGKMATNFYGSDAHLWGGKGSLEQGHTSTLNFADAGVYNLSSVDVKGFTNYTLATGAEVTLAAATFDRSASDDISVSGPGSTFTLSGNPLVENGHTLRIGEGVLFNLRTGNYRADYQSNPSGSPAIHIAKGATMDITGTPGDATDVAAHVYLAGDGVDGRGAIYKGDSDAKEESAKITLPYITLTDNASIAGQSQAKAGMYMTPPHNTNYAAVLDLTDGGKGDYIFTKAGANIFSLRNVDIYGGTLNVVEGEVSLSYSCSGGNTDVVLHEGTLLTLEKNAPGYTPRPGTASDPYSNAVGTSRMDHESDEAEAFYNGFSLDSLSGAGKVDLGNNGMIYLIRDKGLEFDTNGALVSNGNFAADFGTTRQEGQIYYNEDGYEYAQFSGEIVGAGRVTKTGKGTQYFTGGESTYSGETHVLDGVLYILDSDPTDDNPGSVASTFARGNTAVLKGAIGIADLVWESGVGTTGGADPTARGSVWLGDGVRLFNGGKAAAGVMMTLGVSADMEGDVVTKYHTATYSGVLSGEGTFEKVGLGTLVFDQDNEFTGGGRVTEGTLALKGWAALDAGTLAPEKGATLMLAYDADPTYVGETTRATTDFVLNGTGDTRWVNDSSTTTEGRTAALISNIGEKKVMTMAGDIQAGTKDGNFLHCGKGRLILTGANSYTGGTMITDGTLVAASSTALGATAQGGTAKVELFEGANLEVAQTATADTMMTLAADNNILGAVTVGSDSASRRAILTMAGSGYYARTTELAERGALVFSGVGASNWIDGNEVLTGAGTLAGTGTLAVSDRAGTGTTAYFAGTDATAGFAGNLVAEGDNTLLRIGSGAIEGGSVSVSGRNARVETEASALSFANGEHMLLRSTADAHADAAAGASVAAKSVTVGLGGRLSVLNSSTNYLYSAATSRKAVAPVSAASMTFSLEESLSSYASPAGTEYTTAANISEADAAYAYDRAFMEDVALNKLAAGVVEASEGLTLNSGAIYELSYSNTSLAGHDLTLAVDAVNKISLHVNVGTYRSEVLPSTPYTDSKQLVLFSNVGEFTAIMTGDGGYTLSGVALTAAAREAGDGNQVYVAKALDFFTPAQYITDETVLVYDAGAGVVFLDGILSVPEPTTTTLSLLALAALAARRRRQ